MSENIIGLKPVGELSGEFVVPDYQRGYRWTEQEVNDLLEDIAEFNAEGETFYCLQPLVVKSRGKDEYEVIDGQQRLTTIFMILKSLGESQKYSLTYETREESEGFLKNIGTSESKAKANTNIDFFHMYEAYKTIEDWFKDKDKEGFRGKLLNNVKFIWYETDESDPIKVFTRLNIGKIPLTNAELIKALFLKRSNFKGRNPYAHQKNIADNWDEIEYCLQDEKFWMFIYNGDYGNSTHIDFIFDLICNENYFGLESKELEKIGNDTYRRDKYRTFRYFYEYFKKEGNSKAVKKWDEIWKIYSSFNEWYSNTTLHNYIGYLIALGTTVPSLLNAYRNNDKCAFLEYVICEIKNKISECLDLDCDYETPRVCLPLLLLHNIQFETNKSNMFQFHLYKKEAWDVEHIDSRTPNDEDDKEEQNLWLCNNFDLATDEDKRKIEEFINDPTRKDFDEMKEMFPESGKGLKEEDKNKINNFALLEAGINRGYKNAMFAMKGRIIEGKINGKITPIPRIGRTRDGKPFLDISGGAGSNSVSIPTKFIPVCTEKVFEKAYKSYERTSQNYWTKSDAQAYKKNIHDILKEPFGVKSDEYK